MAQYETKSKLKMIFLTFMSMTTGPPSGGGIYPGWIQDHTAYLGLTPCDIRAIASQGNNEIHYQPTN